MRILWVTVLLFLFTAPELARSEPELPPLLASYEVDRSQAFVKEQILLTLRVAYPPEAFSFTQSKIQVSNAEIITLYKTEFTETYQQLPYHIVETKYALFGNSKGVVNISGMVFNALLPVSAGGLESKDNPKLVASVDPLSISIQQMPKSEFADESDHWLAASKVTIATDWQVIDGSLFPGTPVTRRVVIKVWGQHPAAVPQQIDLKLPESLRAYPSQAITTTDKTPEGLNGSVTLPITMVASESGNFTLPSLTVPWWDINDRQWKSAKLPAAALDIMSPEGAGVARLYKGATIVLGLLVAGLSLMCGFLFMRGFKNRSQKKSVTTEKQAWRRVKKSLRRDNDKQLRSVIVVWACEIFPDQRHFMLDHMIRTYPQLQVPLSVLDKNLYGSTPGVEPDRQLLLKALSEARQGSLGDRRSADEKHGLYPESIQ